MKLTFYKYQGTGNDFVMVDNRQGVFPKNDTKLVSFLCDRKFGIGADGLILLENDEKSDFKMVYYNADGNESSMCGNGGRCLVAFANYLGIVKEETSFLAVDGLHHATISEEMVSLQMQNVDKIDTKPKYFFLDTGSPHHVQMVENLDNLNVFKEGAKLRYGVYGEKGSNINFVEQLSDNSFHVRTYERGVENETLSCGTGVTAVAISMFDSGKTISNEIVINTPGGELKVSFEKNGSGYKNISLIGPAKQVFKGTIEC
ncbi:diaminopimelate epimerase [Saonia flava]|uniref:Diaminopimelate epimerase n=1 Tax=Saonia flava TaxID=523696 RepID=A0A846QUB9_9FLAO|nr:diaminopimelate epimerase [Saonia flava]NJB70550.1 diaminopimelate epimerase [Saonia flava]